MRDNKINQTLLNTIDEPLVDRLPSSLQDSVLTTVPSNTKSILVKASLAQLLFFQTFGMFIFTYGLTCAKDKVVQDLQVSLSILAGVCMSGFLCGANLTPIVTLMGKIRKNNQITWNIFWVLIAGQVIGCFMGGSLGYALNGVKSHGFTPAHDDWTFLIRLTFGEALGSFILIFFIMHTSNPNTSFVESEVQGYVLVSLIVYIARRFTPLSGMSLNIVISSVFSILADFQNGEVNQFKYVPIYFIGDILGTLLAVIFYDKFYEPLACQERKQIKRLSISNRTY